MNRLFICDPICAQSFGHNLSALHYFSKFLSKEFNYSKIALLTSKYLPQELEDTKNLTLDRMFHHYYQNSMPLINYESFQEERTFKQIVSSFNYIENLAYDDILKINDKYKLTEKDSLFFPSVDFYSVQALLRFLETYSAQKAPKLYLRFIGVMENNTKYYMEPRNELFSLIRNLKRKNYFVEIAAETPKYADFIAQKVDYNVSCLTYPVTGQTLPLKKSERFKILCPGSQREDKGFTKIFDIIKEFTLDNPDLDVDIIIQGIPGEKFSDYQSQLYALPGVVLLEPSITMEEMINLYKEAHLVLLPYDPDVYYLRGSAILMEAISYGRLVVTSSYTAFSDQVKYYNCGSVCHDEADYSQSIRDFYDMSQTKMQRQAHQSRFRYERDCEFSYKGWFQC